MSDHMYSSDESVNKQSLDQVWQYMYINPSNAEATFIQSTRTQSILKII